MTYEAKSVCHLVLHLVLHLMLLSAITLEVLFSKMIHIICMARTSCCLWESDGSANTYTCIEEWNLS